MSRPWEAFADLSQALRQRTALRRLSWTTGLLALILVLVGLIAWLPAWYHHRQAEQELQVLRNAQRQARHVTQLIRAHGEAEQALPLAEQKLQSSMSEAELIQRIARAAGQRGVRLTSQAFDVRQDQRGDNTRQLTLGLQGSYAAVRGLLADLAALPSWLEVLEARLQSDGGAQVQAQLRLLSSRGPREARP